MEIDQLTQFFSEHFLFGQDGLDEFVHSFQSVSFKKGELLLEAGCTEGFIKYISRGYVREFYSKADKEVNTNFFGPKDLATDFSSFFGEEKTRKCHECITDVEVLRISKHRVDDLLLKHSCAEATVQSSFQKMLRKKESLEHQRITKTVEERYQALQAHKPEWLNNIPQYHIASYLNVTPETLSRIRKRIY